MLRLKRLPPRRQSLPRQVRDEVYSIARAQDLEACFNKQKPTCET